MATILIADDDEGVRALFSRVLTSAGYRVLLANDGERAMALLAREPCDLVVADLVMPGREGIETIQAVRKEHPSVKVLAGSGAFAGEMLTTARALGAGEALAKPVTRGQLLAAVRRLLEPD